MNYIYLTLPYSNGFTHLKNVLNSLIKQPK